MRNDWTSFLTEGETKTVGIIVCLDENSHFLIIRRSKIDRRAGQWTMPGGHIDDEDISVEQGALRELKEETDLVCNEEDLSFLGQPKPEKYYFLTTRWDGDVNVYKPNPKTGDIEHDYYKWATIDDIKDIKNTEIPIYLLEKALEMSQNAK